MRHILALALLWLARPTEVEARRNRKTRIYIDEAPLYTSLPSCAQGRLSAIVRAQVSGCGDAMQLTSFSCFCIDSSSAFVSIISTDIMASCTSASTSEIESVRTTTMTVLGSGARRVRPRATAATVTASPTPTGGAKRDVASALEVFGSYCARSTELARSREPETITAAPIVPQTSPAPDISSDEQVDGKLIAAIVISSIVAFVAMMAAVLFYLDRRRKRTGPRDTDSTEVEGPGFSTRASSSEKDANLTQIVEVMGDKQQRLELERNEKVMSVYEMYQMPIELEAAGLTPERGATQSSEKQGWI